MTVVSIDGQAIHIDGVPTYPGRRFEGHLIEGLLFNVRAVQAIYDDANPQTRTCWAYPDTGEWDPDRNTAAFCEALPAWRAHGVLGFTVNLQGGGPLYVPEIYRAYDNNGFTPVGDLKPDYAARLSRVLERADELGMVAIVGLFYWVSLGRMAGEDAIWRAARQGLAFLRDSGRRNVLVEAANEVDVVHRQTGLAMFDPARVHRTVARLKEEFPELLISTSGGGMRPETGSGMPTDDLVAVADFVLPHGNGTRPAGLEAGIRAIRALPAYERNPKPILINEDSPAVPNLDAAWRNYASWGYYDQGFEGQAHDPYEPYQPRPRWADRPLAELNGYQTPPVNWGINTPFKRAFFDRVAVVTGSSPEGRAEAGGA